jgi:6-phosphogluconolactonase
MKSYFYCGVYKDKKVDINEDSSGISLWSVDQVTGLFNRESQDISVIENTHFSINSSHVYAAQDIFSFNNKDDGCISVYRRENDGQLANVQQVSSEGIAPLYTRLVANNRFMLTANYLASNIIVYPIKEDGNIGDPIEKIQHIGNSINVERQEAAHPHAIEVSVDEKFVYVADLGMDMIKVYELNSETGKLSSRNDLDVNVNPGSGPRHIRFHPNGRFAYLIHEMSNQVSAYTYEDGKLSLLGYWDLANNDNSEGMNTGAELHIHPSGRYLYASSRGENIIVVFDIDQESGTLTRKQTISSEGDTPTSFDIDPTGRVLVVGNQLSNSLTSVLIDTNDGTLCISDQSKVLGQPIMIGFI